MNRVAPEKQFPFRNNETAESRPQANGFELDWAYAANMLTAECPTGTVLRFAAFEVDLRTGELHKSGMRVRLQEQPFKVLAMLLESPGELVTREQIKERLWPADTFVDFEHSVNAAIRRLREALNDQADAPRFIETLPRRGYRFVGSVSHVGEEIERTAPVATKPVMTATAPGRAQRWITFAAVLIILAAAVPMNWTSDTIDSIAVLPFVNETKDPNLDYLADGAPGRVMDVLSAIPRLRVAPRNSAFLYRDPNIKTKEAAAALRVRALLLGAIRKNGNQLQLTAELIDAKDDKHLWGETYNLASGIADIDEAIAGAVAERLHQQLRAPAKEATNPIAYDACLRGDYLMDVRTNESFRLALEFFNKAIDADPNYSSAWAAMAKAYGLLAWYGGMPASQALPLQEAAADRALELDAKNALALINKAAALGNYHRDPNAAEEVLRKAVALGANDPVVQHVYSIGLRRLGKMDEAIAAAKRAEELDPVWKAYAALRAETYYDARHYDDAIRLREERPSLKQEHVLYALVYAALGKREETLAELAQVRFDERASPYMFCAAAQAYARAGEKSRAADLIQEGVQRQRRLGTETTQGCTPYDAAAAYAALGDRAKMLATLRDADRTLDSKLQWIKIDSAFDAYRSDAAFQQIVTSEYTPR